jgi:hypothetical protein
MPKEREVTRIYKWKPLASRPIGRPKNRWEDDVRKDWQTVKVKKWKKSVLNRDLWKAIVEQTKTHVELQCLSSRMDIQSCKVLKHYNLLDISSHTRISLWSRVSSSASLPRAIRATNASVKFSVKYRTPHASPLLTAFSALSGESYLSCNSVQTNYNTCACIFGKTIKVGKNKE